MILRYCGSLYFHELKLSGLKHFCGLYLSIWNVYSLTFGFGVKLMQSTKNICPMKYNFKPLTESTQNKVHHLYTCNMLQETFDEQFLWVLTTPAFFQFDQLKLLVAYTYCSHSMVFWVQSPLIFTSCLHTGCHY